MKNVLWKLGKKAIIILSGLITFTLIYVIEDFVYYDSDFIYQFANENRTVYSGIIVTVLSLVSYNVASSAIGLISRLMTNSKKFVMKKLDD